MNITTDQNSGVHEIKKPVTTGTVRLFETGATRDTDQGKLDYEAFLSPLVLKRFAEYMHQHRKQADGTLRDGDNWQKGIPIPQYVKSMWRHFFDVWSLHRASKNLLPQQEENLVAVMFNVMGMLHEILKLKEKTKEDVIFATFEQQLQEDNKKLAANCAAKQAQPPPFQRFFKEGEAAVPGIWEVSDFEPLKGGEFFYSTICGGRIIMATKADEALVKSKYRRARHTGERNDYR